ncbi:MAG: hypothetical protein ABIO86_06170 [Sphingomonas sp.]
MLFPIILTGAVFAGLVVVTAFDGQRMSSRGNRAPMVEAAA